MNYFETEENEYQKYEKRAKFLIKLGVSVVVILIIGVISAFKFFERIENGYVGVRYSINGGIRDEVLKSGGRFVGFDKVIQYPIRLQTIQAKNISVSTSDGKKTLVNIKYDYAVESNEAAKMYKQFGNITSEDIEAGWLKSKLQKVAREVYAKYSLLNVLSGDSSKVEAEVLENFTKAVESKGFRIDDVVLGVPDVDSETQKSIDAIIRAGQENEKAKLDAETAITNAKKDSDVKKQQADADFYSKQKEAQGNAELAKSVTDELVRYKEAQAREKHGWVTVNGADSVVTQQGN